MTLGANRLTVEGDSLMMVAWLAGHQDRVATAHPQVCDIRNLLPGCASLAIQYTYCKANNAMNWINPFVAHHFGTGVWNDVFILPTSFQNILFSDLLGCTHTQLI